MDWKDVKIHVIDFEGSVRSGIVEYGVATLFGGEIVDAATRLCSVREPIPAEESDVHGIFDEDVRDCAPIEADWEFFRDLRRSGLLGSHHAPAEIGMLGAVWPRPGNVPDFSLKNFPPVNDWGPWVDTCRIAQTWFPGESRYKLGMLVERFELRERVELAAHRFCPQNRSRYHCALYDAIAAAILLVNMCAHPRYCRSEILDLIRAGTSARNFAEHIQGELGLF